MTLTPMQGLTRAITLMVSQDDDVVDVVATLLGDAQESIGAAAGALLATFVATRIGAAFDGRTLIEQAKGVLAYCGGISGEAAYAALLSRAHEHGVTLAQTAAHILESAIRS